MGGVHIEGTSLACLVAADCLARANVAVRLAAPGPLGRSFAPMVANGHRLELGPRLLELTYDEDAPERERIDPRYYEPTKGHRPWMIWIREYIESLVKPRPVRLLIARKTDVAVDFLLSGDLRWLAPACTNRERRAIEADALLAMRAQPSGLSHWELRNTTYREASRLLHGDAFHHRFIAPIIDAILGPGNDIRGCDHRKIWLPLFAPYEVLQGLWGESKRPRRNLWLGMTDAVENLLKRVELLREADLGKGPHSRIVDVGPATGPSMKLQFVWRESKLDNRVAWLYDEPELPYRCTVVDGVECWEGGPGWVGAHHDVLASQSVRVPLTDPIGIDPGGGFVGGANFNDHIICGIAAAAWRLP